MMLFGGGGGGGGVNVLVNLFVRRFLLLLFHLLLLLLFTATTSSNSSRIIGATTASALTITTATRHCPPRPPPSSVVFSTTTGVCTNCANARWTGAPVHHRSSVAETKKPPPPHRQQHQSIRLSSYSGWDGDSNDDDDGGDDLDSHAAKREEKRKRRMKNVRSLQKVFYSTPRPPPDTAGTSPSSRPLDEDSNVARGDVLPNVPLYRRYGQTELPGRSTLLYVADPRYLHMFESILRSSNGYYEGVGRAAGADGGGSGSGGGEEGGRGELEPLRLFGQLNIPGDTGNHYDDTDVLVGWRDHLLNPKVANKEDGVELIGTLVRIVDYRRLTDGRMVLLVRGLERFVVEVPRQVQPYSIADVRILPDAEDVDDAILRRGQSRREGRVEAWWEALSEDGYGCCNDRESRLFPGNADEDVSVEDLLIGAVDLEKLMPLAPFVVPPVLLRKETASLNGGGENALNDDNGGDDGRDNFSVVVAAAVAAAAAVEEVDTVCSSASDNDDDDGGASLSVEMELLRHGVLRDMPSLAKATAFLEESSLSSAYELERRLWNRIDDYVRVRSIKYDDLPCELIRLLPIEAYDWTEVTALWHSAVEHGLILRPNGYGGDKKEEGLELEEDNGERRHAAHRRQRRLAYASTVLLGGTARSIGLLNKGMRQKLLEVPSTRGRLWAALECFDEFLQHAGSR